MTFHPKIQAINPADQVWVSTPADVAQARDIAHTAVWGSPGLPTVGYTPQQVDVQHAYFSVQPNMERLDSYRVSLPYGATTDIWLFTPTNKSTPKGGLVIHGGHTQNVCMEQDHTIARWVAAGFYVVGISMPISAGSPGPMVLDTPKGYINFTDHAQFAILWARDFNPLRFFLDPVVAGVDLLKSLGCEKVGMAGLSGGGWTTVVSSALDGRIEVNYPVAGSWPLYARSWGPMPSWGDWEQWLPGFAPDLSYLDLYVMGASNGKQVAFYIEHDDCCFAGFSPDHWRYEVAARAATAGGIYGVAYDTVATHHAITPWIEDVIYNDFVSLFS